MGEIYRHIDKEYITIYTPYDGGYKKTYVSAIWKRGITGKGRELGVFPINAIKIYIFDLENYKTFNNGKGWHIGIGNEKQRSYIVRGKCEFNFPVTEELSGAIREFEKTFKYYKAEHLFERFEGREHMRHLEVVCI